MISLFLFGFLFHKSILIFSPIIFLQKKGLIVNKFLIAIFIPIVLFLSYYYFSYIQMIWKYYVVQSQLHTTSSENHQRSISYGSSIRSYLNIPAILLFFLFFKNFRIFEDRRLQLINDCMKKIECLAWSNQKIIRGCRQRFIVSDAWEK